MNDALPQVAGLVFSAIILVRAEPAIDRMSRCTPPMVRAAFLLIAGGALAMLLLILGGMVPSFAAVMMAAGVAGLLLCERRMRVLLPHPRRKGNVPGGNHAQG